MRASARAAPPEAGFLRLLRAEDTYVRGQAGILMTKPLWPPP
jgi:hypothetical protein